ncbi:MAG: class I SAM-dependent methyltransferase [Treponema sp.]|jgi:23S rRNA G2069 N7-methylase RlmK/C1962 C5-methylase RlmI|nr:class I SAM-dependent methyltransferase [Treponema sp.]
MNIDTHQELLFNRLSKRFRHLKKWARRMNINAFRLYDRDIPEIPLVLDIYDDAVSGALYVRREKNAGMEERYTQVWLSSMKTAVARSLDISDSRVFLKERRRMHQRQEGDQYTKVSASGFYRDVREGDMRFRVNLSDYLDTGLFLDSRKKRALIRGACDGKRVLNLFAYTGTLSVCAAIGGAKHVDSVDLSNTYLEWAKVNFALNGLQASYEKGEMPLIRENVITFIAEALRNKLTWDVIILDPPAFSNSKKMQGTLDIRRDHEALIKQCLSLLKSDGTLYFSSNAKGFSLETGETANYSVKDLRPLFTDEDFKGKRMPANYSIKLL